MSKSVNRVKAAAEAAGLATEILRMPDSTRTAEEAAAACGCEVAQIVKSLIFKGAESGALKLLLVSGSNQVDLAKATALAGEPLERADPKEVREVTGFAIGGVAPIGHLVPVETWMDEALLGFETVWAAAGAPNAVFETEPLALRDAAGATVADLS
ncbi:YbaK/EbsC family protein [Nisaea acidiphila]|uniref:YbaK/EbsC family protein n=1 Tax=Nisaea acidiphila TaxID=1862145 RepID=A0A9J7AQT4_9PROT|nr:YbaK/EbsC family protein [Nisaea acidiphila]UUX48708.1 YbaK/EbsC family protein [Nisaea acidiphila]